jgi:peptidoglycan/xylan/chitin deacetylase (PgdA/CDA1 family)
VSSRGRRAFRKGAFAVSRIATWSSGRRSANCILMYHGHQPGVPWAVEPAAFEDQMLQVMQRARVALLTDLPRLVREGSGQTICLTFDDGLLSNYEVSLAVLEKLDLKGTFFLIPGLLGRVLRTRFGDQPVLAASQAKEIAALGHEMGAHTMTHPNLTNCSIGAARLEIERSKHTLEDLVGREITSFAYPYGGCTPHVRDLVRETGFRLAVGTEEGHLTSDSDLLELPRVAMFRAVTTELFQMKLSPAWPTYLRLKGRTGS